MKLLFCFLMLLATCTAAAEAEPPDKPPYRISARKLRENTSFEDEKEVPRLKLTGKRGVSEELAEAVEERFDIVRTFENEVRGNMRREEYDDVVHQEVAPEDVRKKLAGTPFAIPEDYRLVHSGRMMRRRFSGDDAEEAESILEGQRFRFQRFINGHRFADNGIVIELRGDDITRFLKRRNEIERIGTDTVFIARVCESIQEKVDEVRFRYFVREYDGEIMPIWEVRSAPNEVIYDARTKERICRDGARVELRLLGCELELRAIGRALQGYTRENEGRMPQEETSGEVFRKLKEGGFLEALSPDSIGCPATPLEEIDCDHPEGISYYFDLDMPEERHKKRAIAADRAPWEANHEGVGVNVLFEDGTVKFIIPEHSGPEDKISNPYIEEDTDIYAKTGDPEKHAWIRWEREQDGE